jgi:drug/metabolite transporter (DMT)-like permease
VYLGSVALVAVSLVAYQLAQRSNTAGANPWVPLLVAYIVGAAFCVVALVATSGFGWDAIRGAPRGSLLLGISIVGIEFGYLEAQRSGWHPASVGLVGNISATLVLAVVAALFLGDRLSPREAAGIGLCAIGLAVLVSSR